MYNTTSAANHYKLYTKVLRPLQNLLMLTFLGVTPLLVMPKWCIKYYWEILNDQFIFNCDATYLYSISSFTKYKISSTYSCMMDSSTIIYFLCVLLQEKKWRKVTARHERRIKILIGIIVVVLIEAAIGIWLGTE